MEKVTGGGGRFGPSSSDYRELRNARQKSFERHEAARGAATDDKTRLKESQAMEKSRENFLLAQNRMIEQDIFDIRRRRQGSPS